MTATRYPWFAWLLALALALLPLHAMAAAPAQPAAAGADMGDCHGGNKAPDADAPICAGCGVCHVVQDVTPALYLVSGHAALPDVVPMPVLRGTTTQPDLHPPLI